MYTGVARFDRAHGIARVVIKTKPRVYTAVDHKQSLLSNWLVLCTLILLLVLYRLGLGL